jgi:hypothetical protein
MRFAQRVFVVCGLWGLLIMPHMYFVEGKLGREHPPAITHPEFYYGFVGTVIAFQVAFLIIAYDPRRFRPLMIPAMLEKFLYVFAVIGLYVAGRGHELAEYVPISATIDGVMGLLFVAAFLATRERD